MRAIIVVHPGDKYAKLTIIKELPKRILPSGQARRYMWCRCDCGEKHEVSLDNLRRGLVKSCGCVVGHKRMESKEHKSWSAMRDRCLGRTNKDWAKYGGRGITIDESWGDFRVFYEDMGKRPKGTSLERLDVNGPYNKNNCIWANPKTQANNKRNSIIFNVHGREYEGVTSAAHGESVSTAAIAAWCKGLYVKKTDKYYPPKDGCSWRWKYPKQHR